MNRWLHGFSLFLFFVACWLCRPGPERWTICPASTAAQLAGPDTNANSIRDDIDLWLATLGYTAPQQRALEQLARSHQKAVSCVFSRFEGQDPVLPGTLSRKIEAATANTKDQLKNYLAYSKALDGTVSALPDGDMCE